MILLLNSTNLIAGPGGEIAKALSKNPLIILSTIITLILLSPLFLISYFKRKRKVKVTKKDLREISATDRNFDWYFIKQRAIDSFYRIHSAWSKEDMQEASEWMTDWYWQNQQLAFIDKWKSNNLINVCNVEVINSIEPIHLEYLSYDNIRIVIAIDAKMEDYLKNVRTGKIIQGERGFKSIETFWTFELQSDKWVVGLIETQGRFYYKTTNEVNVFQYGHNSKLI